jgi:hypothetical protein
MVMICIALRVNADTPPETLPKACPMVLFIHPGIFNTRKRIAIPTSREMSVPLPRIFMRPIASAIAKS